MTNATKQFIRLNEVRLSYPALFQKRVWKDSTAKAKYEANFILDKVKHAKEITDINNIVDLLLEEAKVSRNKIKSDHLCLKDGDLMDQEEYKGAFILRSKSDNKPILVGRDAITPVEDDLFYGGCYVSAHIKLRFYEKPAHGISALLKAVQFRDHGPRFDGFNLKGAFEPKF